MTTHTRPLDKQARTRISAIAVCLSLLSSCATGEKRGTATAPSTPQASMATSLPDLKDLRPREDLPMEVREMLSARMDRHGEQMTDLLLSVVMLEYDLVKHFASKLGGEPKLGRPAAGEKDTLNAMLPRAFFVHQDELAESARALARAAEDRDDQQLVQSFGAVTKSCVGCHSVYRTADFAEFDHDEPSDEGPCEFDEPCDDGSQASREPSRRRPERL